MSRNAAQKTRVLFFAWGDSIHARRRIQIFTNDPTFEVGVISNYKYDFNNAENLYLSDTGLVRQHLSEMSLFRKTVRGILTGLLFFLMRFCDWRTTLYECYRWIADTQLTRDYTKKFNPDIIFLQTLLYPSYLSFILSRKIPLMITFWNGDVIWWARWSGLDRLLKKKIVEYGVNRASAMTVNSRTAFDACQGYGVPSKKIHMIRYPGVDLERFKPASREYARQCLGIESGKVILCPRGLGGYLNSDVIIEAAAAVITEMQDALFLFISGTGGDEEWQQHLRRGTELGIANNLRYDGQVPWEAMSIYYQAADVVVSISSNDSLPNCMLEAMACGIPLVMGDIPQIGEWVKDGVNGFLVSPRDPKAIAQASLSLLSSDGTQASAFVSYNIDLVRREVDCRKNACLVKQLVHDIAGKHSKEECS
ncbi:MAG: glycosyltransferase family 4 protein [Nitrospirae bacterium]|nr:glycosyltransferase family 4 protein [Nitrospirota bacterium]